MDEFSLENFDPNEYLNSHYENTDICGDSSKEIFVTNLLANIQEEINKSNSILEDKSQEILIGLPKLMKDSIELETEVLQLKTKLTDIQIEINKVEGETGDCMKNIEYLDNLKSKLQISKEGLQESDGWGKLINELEELFERSDLWKISDKLELLQKSLGIQEKLPGQAERESQVEGFKNRLEALASPAVVQCFSVGDLDETRNYMNIFNGMNRFDQFLQYYRTVQKTNLQQQWNEILDLSESSDRFLREFYELLAESHHKQSKWCINAFGKDGIFQSNYVLIELFKSLRPSRESQILSSMKRTNEKLEILLEFSESNKYFGNLLNINYEKLPTKIPNDQLNLISSSIFDYFNTFINQYPSIEHNYLLTSLENFKISAQTSAMETIRTLGNVNKKIFEWCSEALARCEKITDNCAITPLIINFISIFKNYIEKYKKAQVQLSASKNIEENWSLLQNCMTLLQNFGDFFLSLQEFEKILQEIVLEIYSKQENLPTEYFGYRLLEKRDRNDLKKLATKIRHRNIKKIGETNFEYGIFESLFDQIKPICEDIHDSTLSAVFKPIEKLLENIEPISGGNNINSDLPDYSFAPQEFITQIGSYLITLPQHLEPILSYPSKGLKFSLEACDDRYEENGPDLVLLNLVTQECCAMYQNKILKIICLENAAAKQISTDIEYLNNVLEELGSSITPHLQQTATLLKTPTENYLSLTTGFEPRLVAAIRQMRNIISTD